VVRRRVGRFCGPLFFVTNNTKKEMRKIVYSIFLILLCGQIFGQALDQFNGSVLIFGYNLSPTTSDSSDFRILGQFGDARGQYTGTELLVGDLIFIARGVQCAPYEVTVIHFSGPIFDVELKDLTDWGTPDGAEGIVTHLTPNKGYPMIPPEGSAPNGNANPLRACVMDHLINLLDLEEGDTDTDTIYAAYSKLPGEAVDSIVRIVRNDTFPIYTSDPVIQIKGQNGLNSSTDTVKLGGVLIEQTYVSSYNPDDARGYTMQFDYTGDGTRDNFIRLDSLGTIRFRATDTTSNNPAIAEQLFQRAGRKLILRQISDDRGRLFDNFIVLEDRDLQIENQDSTGTRSAGLYLRDGLKARLNTRLNDSIYFEVFVTGDPVGGHRGIFLLDSAAVNSEVVPGAVWQAVNNVGGGKWSDFSLDDVATDSLFFGVDGVYTFIDQGNGVSDSINFTALLSELDPDGNGIYSGDGSLVENTLVSGSTYDFVLSSSGDIIFGDFLGGGQLLTLRQDIGGVAFTSVDSFFTVNGIEFPNASPTAKGFAAGRYLWSVDESGQGWTYVNVDSLGGEGGGGGADGDGIYSGSGSLPGNVLVTGGANNLTINSSGNITLGEYPTNNYIRTVGGLNQVAIMGTGGTTINGIAHHVQDAQTAGKPAGTYLTTHNATGGAVTWRHVDSLPYLKTVPDSAYLNGLFEADNEGGTTAVSNFLMGGDMTMSIGAATTDQYEISQGGPLTGGSVTNYMRIRGRVSPANVMTYDLYMDSVLINNVRFPKDKPAASGGGTLPAGVYLHAYRQDGSLAGISNTGHYPLDSLLGNYPATDSLYFGVDGAYTFIDQNNGVSDSINFESFLSEITEDGNGLFDAGNDGDTTGVSSYILGQNLTIGGNNKTVQYDSLSKLTLNFGNVSPVPELSIIKSSFKFSSGETPSNSFSWIGYTSDFTKNGTISWRPDKFTVSLTEFGVGFSEIDMNAGSGKLEIDASGVLTLSADSIRVGENIVTNAYELKSRRPDTDNMVQVTDSDGSTDWLPYTTSPLTDIDSLFYQLNTEAPVFVNQTDGANDTIIIETDATALQYAVSYVTGGSNSGISAETGPQQLNLTTTGTVDTIISSPSFQVMPDGKIVYSPGSEFDALMDVEVDISGLAVGSGVSSVRFYLAKNGTYIPESRYTSRLSGLSAEGHISCILSVSANDTISVVGVPDVNTMTFTIQDQRIKLLKLR
jgi:hypothetical protein